MISGATGSLYSHAAIYSGENAITDANPGIGVTERSASDYVAGNTDLVIHAIWRPNSDDIQGRVDKFAEWAAGAGIGYERCDVMFDQWFLNTYLGINQFVWDPSGRNRMHCFELCGRAFDLGTIVGGAHFERVMPAKAHPVAEGVFWLQRR